MEQNQDTTLFGFGIDDASRSHLAEAAKWAKFLAIVGFVMCGFIVIASFFIGTIFSTSFSRYNDYSDGPSVGGGFGILITLFYLAFGLLYFFPCLFLFRFANHMKSALNTNDQLTLNKSFQNLKIMFRFVGILTIIVISLYVLLFFVGIMSAVFMAR